MFRDINIKRKDIDEVKEKESAKTERRYRNYIKEDLKNRNLPEGYKRYLDNLILTSELNFRKIAGNYKNKPILLTFMDLIQEKIISNKNANKKSKIYRSLEKNEKKIFGIRMNII